MIKRGIRVVAFVFLVLLSAAGVVTLMAASEWGTRWLVGGIASVVPGLSVGKTEGTLLGDLQLSGISHRGAAHEFRAVMLRLKWQPARLLDRVIQVDRLEVVDVDVALRSEPAAVDTEGEASSPIGLPFGVVVTEANLKSLRVARDDRVFMVDAVHFSGEFNERQFDLNLLTIDGEDAKIELSGSVGLGPPHAIGATMTWRWAAESVDVGGTTEISGDLERLAFRHRGILPAELSLTGQIDLSGSSPAFDVDGEWEALRWPIGDDIEIESQGGSLSVTGNASEYSLAVSTRLDARFISQLRVELTATGSLTSLEEVDLSLASTEASLVTTGAVDWSNNPRWTFDIQGRGINPGWFSPDFSGQLDLDGVLSGSVSEPDGGVSLNLERLRFEHASTGWRVDGDLSLSKKLPDPGPWDEPAQVAFTGRFDHDLYPGLTLKTHVAVTDEEVEIHQARFEGDGGDLNIAGDVRWSPVPDWRLSVVGTNINPGVYLADWPGALSLDLASEGTLWGENAGVRVDVREISGEIQEQTLEGKLVAALRSENFTTLDQTPAAVMLNGSMRALALPETVFGVEGELSDTSLQIDRAEIAVGDGELDVQGSTEWGESLRWTLRYVASGLNLKTLQTGLDGILNVEGMTSGRIDQDHLKIDWIAESLSGELFEYDVDAELSVSASGPGSTGGEDSPPLNIVAGGEVVASGLPPLAFDLGGAISESTLKLMDNRFRLLDGEIRLTGSVDYGDASTFDLRVAGEALNPSRHWETLPTNLTFHSRIGGGWQGDALNGAVDIESVEATWPDQSVEGLAEVAFGGNGYRVEQLVLKSGENRIEASGRWADDISIRFVADAPRLETVWPGLSGSLVGRGGLEGPPSLPNIDADFSMSDVAFGELALNELTAEFRVDSVGQRPSVVDIQASDLRAGDLEIRELRVNAQGQPERHQVDMHLESTHANVIAAIAGSYEASQWRGAIDSLDVALPDLGHWRSDEEVALWLTPERGEMGRTCLRNDAAAACVEGNYDVVAGQRIAGEVNDLPLAMAAPWLPADFDLEGKLNGRFAYDQKAEDRRGAMLITSAHAQLRATSVDDKALSVSLDNVRLEADYVDDTIDVVSRAEVDGSGLLDGDFTIGLPTDGDTGAIDGRITLDLPDATLLSPFLSDFTVSSGAFLAEATVAGSLRSPSIQGRVEATDLEVAVLQLGITLTEGVVELKSQGTDTLVVSAGVRSGEGQIEVSGSLDLDAERGWPLALSVAGSDFEIVNLPEVRANVSPDVEVVWDGKVFRTRGSVEIPFASVVLKGLPAGTVAVSSDEIIVGTVTGEAPVDTAPSGVPLLDSALEIRLGDEVAFSGLGVETRLTGQVDLFHNPETPPRALGILNLEDGSYSAFGQSLVIEKGEFTFTGPVDNPSVDIRASRRAFDGTVAGVRLTGRLSEPVTTVYSDPAMDEMEALSYLLTGRSLSAGGGAFDRAELATALLELGLERDGGFTERLSQTFGLDTATVQTGGGVEGAGLALGKYMTPDLYIGYVVGLFQREHIVEMLYRISDNLHVRAQSGSAQAMDLIYRLERE